jgi:hypothetical protein
MDTGRKVQLQDNGRERRKAARKDCHSLVILTHPAMGTVHMTAVNISDGGALLDAGSNPLPPVGALVSVRFPAELAMGDEAHEMLVVHKRRGFLGLRFLSDIAE